MVRANKEEHDIVNVTSQRNFSLGAQNTYTFLEKEKSSVCTLNINEQLHKIYVIYKMDTWYVIIVQENW